MNEESYPAKEVIKKINRFLYVMDSCKKLSNSIKHKRLWSIIKQSRRILYWVAKSK